MKAYFERFIEDEQGAVTVDWIVITAFLVALALSLVAVVKAASLGAISGWFG